MPRDLSAKSLPPGIFHSLISNKGINNNVKVETFKLPCLNWILPSSPSMKIQIVGEKITENLGFQLATDLVWLNCLAKLLLFGSAQKTGPLTTDRIQINHVENVFFQ